jgi:hypothetical protein
VPLRAPSADLGDRRPAAACRERKKKPRAVGGAGRVLRPWGRWDAKRRFSAGQRIETAPQVGENFVSHPRAYAAGVDELAVIGVVAQQ